VYIGDPAGRSRKWARDCISLTQGWDHRQEGAVTTAENLPTKPPHSAGICGSVTLGRR
jgi:hypothetical protein